MGKYQQMTMTKLSNTPENIIVSDSIFLYFHRESNRQRPCINFSKILMSLKDGKVNKYSVVNLNEHVTL